MAQDTLRLVGQRIGDKYLIEAAVGEGGFGLVYRARHTIWGIRVAVKVFTALGEVTGEDRGKLLQAFVNEGALLARLSTQTSAIVQAHDVGELTDASGRWFPYIVLEWLEGATLEEWLGRVGPGHSWTVPEALAVIGPIANALEVAHGQGIAHRDVKPANVFVVCGDPRRSGVAIKLLDFGIAKTMADARELNPKSAATGLHVASFTPQYGAPEQFSRSFGATGPWTDVYALALVAVELLAGRPALEGDDVAQLGFASTSAARRPTPRACGAAVSDAVEAVFAQALALMPEERFTTAGAFLAALQGAAGLAAADGTAPVALSAREAAAATELAPTPTDPLPRDSTGTVDGPNLGRSNFSGTRTLAGAREGRRGRTALTVGAPVLATVALGVGALSWSGVFGARQPGATPVPSAPTPAAAPVRASAAAAAPSSTATPCPAGMVRVPAGQYFMGSDEDGVPDHERPRHHVRVAAFCIDRTEVTLAAYRDCSDRGACPAAARSARWNGIESLGPRARAAVDAACNVNAPAERADHPVNCVDWESASRYCASRGGRLPTEAEWEYAARGPDGRTYPWGDEPPTAQHLNACGIECVTFQIGAGLLAPSGTRPLYAADDGFPTTSPVGRFPLGRSRFGPEDIVGNVWEWVADWYGAYEAADQTDPKGPLSGTERGVRGGGFNGTNASWLRPSYRYKADPRTRSWAIGFRCAASGR